MKYITFTTNGSKELCKNFLISTGKVGIEKDVIVYCLDKESLDYLNTGFDCELRLFELSEIQSPFHNYGDGQFRRVTEAKIQIILNALSEFGKLVYSDCDVVFKKNPTDVILQNDKKEVDITFASDAPFMTICTGFMLVKDTPSVHSLFKKYFEHSKQYDKLGSTCMYDQEIIWSILNSEWINDLTDFQFGVYPTDFVTNGHLYWNESEKRTGNEFIIHVNFIIGKEGKINRLKEADLWYVEEGITQ